MAKIIRKWRKGRGRDEEEEEGEMGCGWGVEEVYEADSTLVL